MSGLYLKKGPKAVVLLHAYTGSPNDVRMLARKLEKENYTVIAPLFSGHGTMDPRDILTCSPLEWWEDAKQAVQVLIEDGFQEIAVFGLSLGGIFATKLMENYPEIVVGGGSFSSPIVPNQTLQIFPNFLKYCEIIFKKKGLTEQEIQTEIAQLSLPLEKQLEAIGQVTTEVYDKMTMIRVPVFLGQSAKDEMVDATKVYEMGQRLAETDHEIHWYSKSTHVLTISKDRHQFEQDIIYFLSKLAWDVE